VSWISGTYAAGSTLLHVGNMTIIEADSAGDGIKPRPRAWSTRSPARQEVRSTLDKPTPHALVPMAALNVVWSRANDLY
jgi:hypothetical protein